MSKSLRGPLVVGFVLVCVTAVSADKLDLQGKAWLDAHKDPAAINLSGNWDSDFGAPRRGFEESGLVHLVQVAGSRDVTGGQGSYALKGVVSGKNLYMLFATDRGAVDYCAVFNSELDSDGHTTLSDTIIPGFRV